MADTRTGADPTAGLRPLHATPSVGEYLAQLWKRREYTLKVPLRQLRARNLNNALGLFWFLLNPLMLVAVYFFFFGLLIGTDRGVDNFLTFLAAGVFTYTFMQRTTTSASRTMITHVGLIRALRFPRALLPISETIEQTLAQLPVLVILVLAALLTGETPDVAWLLLIPLTLLQAMFALGAGFVLARVTTHFRDIQNFLPFVFRLVFYMSGVLYSVDAFVSNETLGRLFYLNPFYDHIEFVRFAILGGDLPVWAVVGAVVSSFVMLPLGFVIFRRGEPYGRA